MTPDATDEGKTTAPSGDEDRRGADHAPNHRRGPNRIPWRDRLAAEVIAIITAIVGFAGLELYLFSDLGNRIAQVNSDFGTRLSQVNSDLGKQLSDLGTRLAQVNSDLGARLTQVNSDLGTRLSQVNSDLGTRLSQVNSDLGKQLSSLNTNYVSLNGRIDILQQQVAHLQTDQAVIKVHMGDVGKAVGAQFSSVEDGDKPLSPAVTHIEARSERPVRQVEAGGILARKRLTPIGDALLTKAGRELPPQSLIYNENGRLYVVPNQKERRGSLISSWRKSGIIN
jgi:hypothetical protein